jgi:hypothetical protein
MTPLYNQQIQLSDCLIATQSLRVHNVFIFSKLNKVITTGMVPHRFLAERINF